MATMYYDEDSDENEQQNTNRMNGQITETKNKCNCTKGCSKRICSCFKFGSGCYSSCRNMFNHLLQIIVLQSGLLKIPMNLK